MTTESHLGPHNHDVLVVQSLEGRGEVVETHRCENDADYIVNLLRYRTAKKVGPDLPANLCRRPAIIMMQAKRDTKYINVSLWSARFKYNEYRRIHKPRPRLVGRGTDMKKR
jgi:hypothetical protein